MLSYFLVLLGLGISGAWIYWVRFLDKYMKKASGQQALDGKTVVLIGATDGIGRYSLMEILQQRPKSVIAVGRDGQKGFKLVQEIIDLAER